MSWREPRTRKRLGAGLVGALVLSAGAAFADPLDPSSWSLRLHAPSVPATAPNSLGSIELILDDGSREADIGLSDTAAFQYLWFNRFEAPPEAFDIDEVQVLFPPGPGVAVGDAVELVVYRDGDGDPTNGAQLLAAFDVTIETLDGTSFSTYALSPPVRVPSNSGDVLIGVINRFVVSGVSPPSRPSALDTSSSAGRSWIAVWTGDPPDPPQLPADNVMEAIDFLEPGNWMIRASGSPVPVIEIPTLGSAGLVALVLLLAMSGALVFRRRRAVQRIRRL